MRIIVILFIKEIGINKINSRAKEENEKTKLEDNELNVVIEIFCSSNNSVKYITDIHIFFN